MLYDAHFHSFHFLCLTFLGSIQYELLGTRLVSFFIKPPSYRWACFSRGIYLQQIIPLNRWRAPSWSQYFLIKCSISCRCQATNAIAVAPWGQSLSEKKKSGNWTCLEVLTFQCHNVQKQRDRSNREQCWETNTGRVCTSESKQCHFLSLWIGALSRWRIKF